MALSEMDAALAVSIGVHTLALILLAAGLHDEHKKFTASPNFQSDQFVVTLKDAVVKPEQSTFLISEKISPSPETPQVAAEVPKVVKQEDNPLPMVDNVVRSRSLWSFGGNNFQSAQAAYQAQHMREVAIDLRQQTQSACEQQGGQDCAGELLMQKQN